MVGRRNASGEVYFPEEESPGNEKQPAREYLDSAKAGMESATENIPLGGLFKRHKAFLPLPQQG